MLPRALACVVCLFAGSLTLKPGSGLAQQSADVTGASGEISGRVIDSESRDPLQGAAVVLEMLATGDEDPDAGPRIVSTGDDGEYRFGGLQPAMYRLEVSRIGYVRAEVEIDLRNALVSRLSVGLRTRPITLAPIAVIGGRPEPYGRLQPTGTAESGGSLLIDQLRQERHLVSDTRELTHSEVLAAVTLAETDLFRALQRVPGVSTRDDYTATMWTRGATWDQTRVFFDGLPLYNPTHAGWLFAAVNPDAIASASFHPGYRSARWGEGSAGVLDLQSRSGRPGGRIRGTGEVSMASTRLALDGEVPGATWMIAARRSYVDVLASMVGGLLGDDDLHIPYDFMDFVGRADIDLGRRWTVQASSILEYDHLRGDIPGLLEGNRGRWGNRLARVGAGGPVGPILASATLGGTDFSTLIFEREEGTESSSTLPALENAIRHRLFSLEIEPVDGTRRWVAGLQLVRDSVTYQGPFFGLISTLAPGLERERQEVNPLNYGSALQHTALWGERRWPLGDAVDVLTGMRVEIGDSVSNGGTYRFAPRLAVRAEPAPGVAVTGSWSRSFQYTQDVSPAAGPIGPQLHLSAIWVLASAARAYPAVRTDLATFGAERTWGDGWSVVANVYHRASTGLKVPNPAPGPVEEGRDPDREANNRARGAEITLRRMSGRWTGSLGYAFGSSTMASVPRDEITPAFEYPSSADIRHGFDATGLVRLSNALRVGGAFTFGSGVPFTRLLIPNPGDDSPVRLGPPNAERTPAYASLDLMVEYERRYADWLISGYLQIRNVTNRDNAVTYGGTWNCPAGGPGAGPATYQEVCAATSGLTHHFEPGLPRLPLVGLRIAF